ncbi:response regulator [Actinacidiphila paucisporea]|uniref:Response regulator receiver domain-containing protein n=1 Tax=Actinacidiphila paucisporea TaxID=310782 RepID=A0A1M7PLC3_9ACTN|nr:response regulator [Actinacidiphila paucisporea]SHN17834.1 Response regulator receiver domain-containing protein [Actinacidiphila paucisporea]
MATDERSPTREETLRRAHDALHELVRELAAIHGDGPDGEGGPDELAETLDRLAALAVLHDAVQSQVLLAARDAAAAGANYAQLGAAWNITRQGARKRWPGLVFSRTPESGPPRGGPMDTTAPARSYSVLLVEDDDADALLIEEALLERGTARVVHRATDGISALAHLRDTRNPRPDLLVLDLNMPRMNGRQLLAVLKADPVLVTVPVVVLTTSSAPDDIAGAYREHVNAYVTKPVNLDDFNRAVQGIDDFFLDTITHPDRP